VALLTVVGSTIPPQTLTPVVPSGTTSTSDTIPAGAPGLALLVHNTSGAARNLLINTPASVYGAAIADISIALPTTGYRVVKLPADLADSSGLIGVGMDVVTSTVYAPISL